MAQKKKRNKPYTGKDSSLHRPQVVRVQAVKRTKLGQWYQDRKRVIKPLIKIAIVALVIVVIIVGVVDLIVR